MYCKKCGADVGTGYPEVQFCHMCGVKLAPQEPVRPPMQEGYSQPYGKKLNTQGNRLFSRLSFTRRRLPKNASTLLTIGAVLCLLSMFMNWIAPYTYNYKVTVPRTDQTYKRNQYGDLTTIETRHWYDIYNRNSESFGSTGSEMFFGVITFLIIVGIILSLFFKLNNTMPYWTKLLPTGLLIYFILFWVIGTIQALMSSGGPGFGVVVFPAGVVLLYLGNKRLKASSL